MRGLVTDGDGGTTGTPTDFGPLIDFATRVLAPAGALSAVLYYFGYVRVQALYGYFGADVGSLGFSTVDYVVSSAGTFFVLLVTLLVAGVVAVAGHYLLQHVLEHVDVEPRRLVWVGLGLTATALLVLGVVGLFRRAHPLFSPLFAPCALGAGTALLEYATTMAAASTKATDGVTAALHRTGTVRRALAGGLVLASIFWLAANVALQRGVDSARAIELQLPSQHQAVVYSRDRIQISGPGVNVVPVETPSAAFAFRYNGLRTLVHSGGRWFLLPVGWTHDNGATVILLRDNMDTVRVDLAP